MIKQPWLKTCYAIIYPLKLNYSLQQNTNAALNIDLTCYHKQTLKLIYFILIQNTVVFFLRNVDAFVG